MKKEKSKAAYIFYAVLILLGGYVGVLFGIASDDAKDDNGKLDLKKLQVENVAVSVIKEKLNDKNSNAKKGFIYGAGVSALVLYMIFGNKKRLHRKGEEHGSAKWGMLAEKQKLADKNKYILVKLQDFNAESEVEK